MKFISFFRTFKAPEAENLHSLDTLTPFVWEHSCTFQLESILNAGH